MLRRLVNICRRFDRQSCRNTLPRNVGSSVPLDTAKRSTMFETSSVSLWEHQISYTKNSKNHIFKYFSVSKTLISSEIREIQNSFPDFLSYVKTLAKLRTYNYWAQTVASFVLDGHSDRYQMLSEIALLRVTNLLWFRSCSPLCDTHCLSIVPRTWIAAWVTAALINRALRF